MLWKKRNKPGKLFDSLVLWLLFFVVIFLAVRLPRLGTDAINPDGVNWHYRSEQFIVGIKQLDFAKTFQHYHPGVTLMWIVGVTVEVLRQLFPAERVYTHLNFEAFHFMAKFALVWIQLGLSILILVFLSKILSFKKALLVVLFFSLEPFFVGNSRILHLDVLLALFLFLGLVAAYLGAVDSGAADLPPLRRLKYLLLSGVFLALAFLTKSIGVGGLIFVAGVYSLRYIEAADLPLLQRLRSTRFLGAIRALLPLLLGFFVALFLFFPALWVKPIFTLTEIFRESERIGIRNGHGQIILGEYTRDAGVWFYPLVLLMKISPFTWLGVLCVLFSIGFWLKTHFKNLRVISKISPLTRFLLYLSIFYLGYFVIMILPSKKIDRYMVPVFPYLALLAVVGYDWLLSIFKKFQSLISGVLVLSFILFIILPLVLIYPYYFTYTSPVFGSTAQAHEIIAQKPFGVGVSDLKELLFERYGPYPRLGFFDVKPMRAIYPNSSICDIRVCGTSDYDLLILGPNEELPEKVLTSGVVFVHDTSMFINGLEYWRIYVKTIK